ncbi:MAG: TIR domain-containing protein [Halarcobacter sp.]
MKKQVFISYSHEDKEFVEWLNANLQDTNYDIWYDQKEIQLGDSIQDKIVSGIESSNAFIFVLSNSSLTSKWMQYELNSALLQNASNRGIKILPIKIDNSTIPYDLSNYLYADFSKNKEIGLDILKKALLQTGNVDYELQDWSSFDGRKFENLVYDLLLSENFEVKRTPPTKDGGYDFITKTKNILGIEEKTIVEARFYKNQKISIEVLRKLIGISTIEKANNILLITNSEITKSSHDFLVQNTSNIIIWDRHKLIQKLFSHPHLIKEYFNKKTFTKKQKIKLIDKELENIQKLIKRLDECPEGKEGWKIYEDICVDILNYLFVPPLGKPKIQSRRESGIDIRDAIYPNRNSNENWKFIRDDYDAKYIVFEFKNYSKNGSEIDKSVLLQIDDYLKQTIGRFGIICSKKLPNQSGIEKRKDIFIEKNKLIIFLNNEHLREMLLRKYKNDDPSDVIIDLIDDFNLGF